MPNLHFQKATLAHKDIIFEWLEKPHVKEFWDNSPEHREDIEIFMKGRKEASSYFEGVFTYWVASIEDEPYGFLMTGDVIPRPDLPKEWILHLSKTGKTYCIDFLIGNEACLGKGLSAPTLKAFMSFIQEHVAPSVDTFFIGPAENNPRAIRAYEKAGFQTVAEFVLDSGVFKDMRHFLMIKTLQHQSDM